MWVVGVRPILVLLLARTLPSALAGDIGRYIIQQGISLNHSTGSSGDAFASSCQSALWAYQTASSAYGRNHTAPSVVTVPQWQTAAPSVSASSVTVLCDGYTRAVGSASIVSLSQIANTTYTIMGAPGPYPTSMPCSINPSDCANLYRSYSTAVSSLIGTNSTLLAPPCNVDGSSSITFSSAYCLGTGLNGIVGVVGKSVQLLYWPVRTSDSPEYFCTQGKYSKTSASPLTIPGTPTGSGPNTFVTGTLTITSPTIALAYSDLSRVDGCGTTIQTTIITMRPEELASIRGGRALYDLRPFNYGDLNWMCPSQGNSSHFTAQDVEGKNCYQNVPAQAYWNAAQNFDVANYHSVNEIQKWTIINNYQPYVRPNDSVWSETMHSLWGTSARWYIDGSWDPPIALSEAAAVAKPTLPASFSAKPTAETPTYPAMTTKPLPQKFSDTFPSSTASPQATANVPDSSHDGAAYDVPSSGQGGSPSASSQADQNSMPGLDSSNDAPSSGQGGSSPASSQSDQNSIPGLDSSNNAPPSGQGASPSASDQADQNSTPGLDSSNNAHPSGQGVSPPASGSANQNPAPSVGSSDVVIETQTIPFTYIPAPGTTTLMAVFASETLSVGGPAHTISGHVISAAPGGLMVDGAEPSENNPTGNPAAGVDTKSQNDQNASPTAPGDSAASNEAHQSGDVTTAGQATSADGPGSESSTTGVRNDGSPRHSASLLFGLLVSVYCMMT